MVALDQARRLLREEGRALCLVAGADSYLRAETLTAYEDRDRLLTGRNSDGFIPGEAGAAVLVGRAGRAAGPEFVCLGIGFGREPAPIESGQPLRADGPLQACGRPSPTLAAAMRRSIIGSLTLPASSTLLRRRPWACPACCACANPSSF